MTYDMGRICDIMQGIQRAIVKVLILVPLAVFAAFFAIGPVGLVSYSPATRVGVHSVIAFWISIPTFFCLSKLLYSSHISRISSSNLS